MIEDQSQENANSILSEDLARELVLKIIGERKNIVLKTKIGVYQDFDKLLEDADRKNIKVSLAVFKPTKVLDCIVKEKRVDKIDAELAK